MEKHETMVETLVSPYLATNLLRDGEQVYEL